MNLQVGTNFQDYFSRKRKLDELLRFKDDDSGCIEGKVFMIWPPRNRLHRINLEVAQDSTLHRFEVEIPHKDGITFRPHERVSLSLKGMKVDRRKESSAPYYFPIVLRFPDGVVFKYLSGVNAGKVVDTWQANADEWYNPGAVNTVSDAVATDTSENHRPILPSPRRDPTSCHDKVVKVDRLPPPLIAISDGRAAAPSVPQAQQSSTESHGRSSRTRGRKKRKSHKEKESASLNQQTNNTDRSCLAEVAILCQEKPQISVDDSLANSSGGHSKLPQVCSTNEKRSVPEDFGSDLQHKNDDSSVMATPGEINVPALRLKAGLHTERGDIFTALSDLRKGHSMIDIIAVVTRAQPEKKTSTNEWGRSFTLVDPSTVNSPKPNIKVNCFQKKYVEWLPQVQKDDIVILRKLKIVEFNGVLTATGFSDKLRWAIYDPLNHSIRSPNKGSAPEKEIMDDGMGYEFSPYWQPFPDSNVLEYCRQIGEWWKAKNELEGQNMTIVRCSGAGKQHLLISEASPDLPPQGFFNCTVEVLQKFNNHGPATTVYVTDYTASALVRPVQAAWCPPELSDRVLQCDMWDDAKNIAKMMNPGEYWYFHNIRAKWNPSHYMEGTMQLAEKVTQLDATKSEGQPHLRALLSRKSELGLNKSSLASGSAPSHVFPELLLQDVEESTSFLTCIVELLHNDLNSRDGHFIYVTDYTYNPDLPAAVSTAEWGHDLQHRVLKIKLDDAQAKNSFDLGCGSILIIQNLRIKRTDASGGIHGYLGGEDTLIHSLCDSSSYHAKSLERNKDKWKRESILNDPVIVPRHFSLVDNTTLQEVLACPNPDTFRVLARVMDFFPFSLEDACVLRCTKCKTSPPPSFKHCPRCDDMLDTNCKWFYRVYVLLQDEQGTELIVSLSGKECLLLQDIDPADFRYDQVAFRRFLAKLDPILGNLRDVHLSWSKNEYKVIESPLTIFTIQSWNVEDDRGFGLLKLDCTPKKGIEL